MAEESIIKKIKIKNQTHWGHLRSGWPLITSKLLELHNPYGVLFEDYLDGIFGTNQEINEPWIGIFHNTPKNHSYTNSYYNFKEDRDLEYIVQKKCFKKSMKFCKGIFTLSSYLKKFLKNKIQNVKIESLLLATETPQKKFDLDEFDKEKSIVTVGHWQRLYFNFIKLKGIKKNFLKWQKKVDINWVFHKHGLVNPQDINVVDTLNNEKYDEFLSKTVVFLELFDAGANNIVVECIVRNNPIIINRLESLEEYLGINYPLFYENFEQAQKLVLDFDKIREAHIYLTEMNKEKLSLNYFIESLTKSEIYNSLKFNKKLL